MTDDTRSGGRGGSGPEDRGGRSEGSGGRGRGQGERGFRGGSGRGAAGRGGSGRGERRFGGRDDRGGRRFEKRDDRGGRDGDQRSGDRREGRFEGRDDRRGDDRRGGERRDDRRDGRRFEGRGGRRDDRRGGGGGRGFDRRGDRPQRSDRERDPKDVAPRLPEDVTDRELDGEVRQELATLPRSLAEVVGKHMVMAGRLLEEDPEKAYEHAAYARRRASRVAAVREVAGVAAYNVGKWQEALSDLRAARRMTGRNAFLAIMADAERGLGRPERALELTRSPEAEKLEVQDRIELRIVASGARRDMGETEAALVELQVPELKERRARPW